VEHDQEVEGVINESNTSSTVSTTAAKQPASVGSRARDKSDPAQQEVDAVQDQSRDSGAWGEGDVCTATDCSGDDGRTLKDATPIIQWLISMGWEPDAEKIERLQEIIRDREPTRQPRGVSAKWKD
jgi:hypothetical protein